MDETSKASVTKELAKVQSFFNAQVEGESETWEQKKLKMIIKCVFFCLDFDPNWLWRRVCY